MDYENITLRDIMQFSILLDRADKVNHEKRTIFNH